MHFRHHRHHSREKPKPIVSLPASSDRPLDLRERALLTVMAVHLVFLPWALGTVHVWSQIVSLGFSVASFGLALSPRFGPERYSGNLRFRLRNLPQLLRFPVFWLGMLFLLYILVQALNIAWVYISDGRSWWMEKVPSVKWLPTGMRTPFDQASPWRSLLIYSSAWLTVCAAWIGFARRKSLRLLLVVITTNAAGLALFGLLQRALGADRIFGFWKPPAAYFVASFIYRNHAGAYFGLLLAACCGLAYWYHHRRLYRMEESSPAVVFAFFAMVVAMVILYSSSRGATLLMALPVAVAMAVAGVELFTSPVAGQSRAVMAVFGALVLGFAAVGFSTLNTDGFAGHFKTFTSEIGNATENGHYIAPVATWEMARDKLTTGWGAGSFSFYFPVYQVRHPAITVEHGLHLRWEHAHDDYLELLAEVGIIGCGLLALGGLYYVAQLIRLRFWRQPLVILLLTGCLMTLLHATFDFPFFNPAVLITWCVFWPLMIRWLVFEQQLARAMPQTANKVASNAAS